MMTATHTFVVAHHERIIACAAETDRALPDDVRTALEREAYHEDLMLRYAEFPGFAECSTPQIRLLLAVTAVAYLIHGGREITGVQHEAHTISNVDVLIESSRGARRIPTEEAACAIADLAVVSFDTARKLWSAIAQHLREHPDALATR